MFNYSTTFVTLGGEEPGCPLVALLSQLMVQMGLLISPVLFLSSVTTGQAPEQNSTLHSEHVLLLIRITKCVVSSKNCGVVFNLMCNYNVALNEMTFTY